MNDLSTSRATSETLVNTMAWMTEPGKLELQQAPLPVLPADHVLIRIKAAAICGSDLHLYRGRHPSARLPSAIGHECAGIVEAVGADVRSVKPGDHVTLEPNITCGKCPACRQGQYGYCENISFTYREGQGAIARYIQVREDKVYLLPPQMPLEHGALVEPLAVAVHAVRRANLQMGESVLVIGAGAIGIFVAALTSLRGAALVTVSDANAQRTKLALELGAHLAISPQELEAELENPKGQRFDQVFECVGLEITLANSMRAAKRNGLVTVIGIFEEALVRIPATLFASHEIRMQGSQGYCWDFELAIQMAERLDIKKMISHRFSLDEVQAAFDLAANPGIFKMKVLIEP